MRMSCWGASVLSCPVYLLLSWWTVSGLFFYLFTMHPMDLVDLSRQLLIVEVARLQLDDIIMTYSAVSVISNQN